MQICNKDSLFSLWGICSRNHSLMPSNAAQNIIYCPYYYHSFCGVGENTGTVMQGCHHITIKNLIQLLYLFHFIFSAGEMLFFVLPLFYFHIYSCRSERHRISFLLKKVDYSTLCCCSQSISIHPSISCFILLVVCVCGGVQVECVCLACPSWQRT